MIYAARKAQTAKRFAPTQTRRTDAQAWLFGRYRPSMALWLDSYRTPYGVGIAAPSWTDSSGRYATCTQAATGKQPAGAVNSNIKALRFAGDDGLVTSTLPMNSTLKLSILSVAKLFSNPGAAAVMAEASTSYATIGGAAHRLDNINRLDVYVLGKTSSNVTALTRRIASSANANFAQYLAVNDKTQTTDVNQLTIYRDNTALGLAGANYSTQVDPFLDFPWNIGSENNAAGFQLNGWISQVLIFKIALTTAERREVYRTMQEILGLAWS